MSTDTSEKGIKTLIMRPMTGVDGIAVAPNMVSISCLVADVVTSKRDVREAAQWPDVVH